MPEQANAGVFWRIVDESGVGPDCVTLVFQTAAEEERKALQLETDIVTAEFLSHVGKDHVDVAWTEDDYELFQTLLSKQFPDRYDDEAGFHLDLSDESVIDTIAVLAAARFSDAQQAEDWIVNRHWNTVQRAYEVGDMVALATDEGFCLGVLVALDAVEAEIVLLECVDADTAETGVRLHELVRVYKADLLPDTFGNVLTTEEDTLH